MNYIKLIILLIAIVIPFISKASFDEQLAELEKEMQRPISSFIEEDIVQSQIIGNFNIIEFLNFNSDCYITQDEHGHNTIKGGSMFALDISCNDKSFMIAKIPQYITGGYYVGRVGIDKYLGDYITFNFGDGYTLVYGHTENIYNLKKGDRLTQGMEIGKANISGKSTGKHFHIELWKGGRNITFDLLQENENSYKLRKQRGRLTKEEMEEVDTTLENIGIDIDAIKEIAFGIIQKWEGKHNKAYRDHKGYSIGYGTRSYEGEVISDEEISRRTKTALDIGVNSVISHFNGLNNNQYGALVSMRWNCNSVYNALRKEGISENLRKSCVNAGGKKMKGLELRRNAEWDIFSGK